jgi:ferredoxin-NADP reductase/Na+-translocating ferredoxin:NAD+ oxidoreductase RnfD subunit
MRTIDNLLNRVTMYRLVLYYLIALIGIAVVLSFTRVLAYDPYAMLFSTAFILAACSVTNLVFSRVFGVPANVESTAISALILALIISPIRGYGDLWFLLWASVLAMASKYIINIRGKHILNPAAFGVALTYLTINQSASWWIGNPTMLPFVLVGGLLVVRKLRRFKLVWSFMAAAVVVTAVGAVSGNQQFGQAFSTLFLYSPFFFFAFIMLTEPLTTPPTNDWRNLYGALVGVLFPPAFHLGSFFTTPEIALLIGNVFSWLVSPKSRLVLHLKHRRQISPVAYELTFAPNRKVAFAPGQYMEWTLGHEEPDSRGTRRYFTLASAPTEPELRLGVRFNNPSSTYKQALLEMNKGDEIIAGQLSGDFTMPRNPVQPLVFIAGGIGITPFRSMIKYLLDTHRRRPITLFYGALTVNDFVFTDVFDRAERELGIRTIYIAEKTEGMSPGWVGLTGRVEPEIIWTYAPYYQKAIFYISGPSVMVDAVKRMLNKMGIPDGQIKTDFFAGL